MSRVPTWCAPLIAGLLAAVVVAPAAAQAPAMPLPTPAEVSEYLSFTDADDVLPYLRRVADAGEGMEAGILPGPDSIPVIRIGSLPGGSRPVVRVLVIGAQHGDERAGAEVGLRVARDLAAGPLVELRGHLDVRIVPMVNPEAVRTRRRFGPGGVDLNRDHLRLEASATRALWAEYASWRPHLVLDLHELGPSEYSIQIGVPTHPNVDPRLAVFARYYMLPNAANELARADVRFHEYVAAWVDGTAAEIAAAPVDESFDGASWYTPPPTDPGSARNAFALAGSLAFLVEAASSRDVIGLEARTERMYVAVRALMVSAAELASELVPTVERAASAPDGPLALRSRYTESKPGAELPWIFINDRDQVEQGRIGPWRSELQIDAVLEKPLGWWIVGEMDGLVEVLREHGFVVDEARASDRGVPGVQSEGTATWSDYPSCGDVTVSWPPPPREADGPPPGEQGRWISADQPGARLLFTLIEPWSEGGWFELSGVSGSGAPCADPEVNCEARFPVLRVSR